MKLTYKTVEKAVSFEIPKIKGSKFIGYIFPVSTQEEAEAQLKKLQNYHHQANHNCPAYRVGVKAHQDLFGNWVMEPERSYASDDGEPSGTAAYPMKKVLEGAGLENVLLVVTRYFGGTLLGVGGLVKAYTDAAKAVVDYATIVEKEVLEDLTFEAEQTQVPEILKYCSQHDIKIISQEYGEKAKFTLACNVAMLDKIKKSERVNNIDK